MLVRDGIVPILRQYATPSGLLAEYDFGSGVVSGVQVLNPVAGAVSRDSLQTVGSGQQRRSGLGLLVEKSSTNKCTNTNLKPTDTSGTTSSGAIADYKRVAIDNTALPQEAFDQLQRLDPQGNVTGAYRLEASGSGANVVFNGTTGNTSTHTGTMWAYVESGTWALVIGSIVSTLITASGWHRVEVVSPTPGSTDQLNVISSSAGTIYFFGNQLEQKSERSSLIEVSGSTATRLADLVRAPIPSGFDAASFTIIVEFNKFGTPSAPDRVIFLSRAAGNLQDQIVNGTLISRLTDGAATISGPAYTLGTDRLRAWGADGTTLAAATDGVEDGTATWVVPPGFDFTYFGADQDGTRQVDGNIRRVYIFGRPAAAGSGFSSGFDGGFS